MPATLRFMSWNIQKYGPSKLAEYNPAPIIARVMRVYNIDVCALLEVMASTAALVCASITNELNNLAYKANWKSAFVQTDGSEGVAYFWHEAANAGANAFKGCYANNPGTPLRGKVVKNTAGNRIYFPETTTTWESLPGSAGGRRPGYCTFQTNDTEAGRSFAFLDIHTPFDTNFSIQSYATHLLANSRESQTVDAVDAAYAVTQAMPAAIGALQRSVDHRVTTADSDVTPADVRQGAVEGASTLLVRQLAEGAAWTDVLQDAAEAGSRQALGAFTITSETDGDTARAMAEAVAVAGAAAAAFLMASIQRPSAPNSATASAQASADEAARVAASSLDYGHPSKPRSAKKILATIRGAAKSAARDAVAAFRFAAPATVNVTRAIIAGDFNVNHPDATGYHAPAVRILGRGNNAYTALETLSGGAAAVTAPKKTTLSGASVFKNNHIYRLRNPCPIQNRDPRTPATYVPLDVSSLVGVDLVGHAAWVDAITRLAQAQNVKLAPYEDLIFGAFDSTRVINDTSLFRANTYDNLFARGTTIRASDVIDVLSELGSWRVDAGGRWVAARASLNRLVQPTIAALAGGAGRELHITANGYDFDVTPAVGTAEQAAIFFLKYISDHLPVYVEVNI